MLPRRRWSSARGITSCRSSSPCYFWRWTTTSSTYPTEDCLVRLSDAVNAIDFNMPASARVEQFTVRDMERQAVSVVRFDDHSTLNNFGTAAQQSATLPPVIVRLDHQSSPLRRLSCILRGHCTPRARKWPGRNGPESYKSASQMPSPTSPLKASLAQSVCGLDEMSFVATAATASSSSIASGSICVEGAPPTRLHLRGMARPEVQEITRPLSRAP